MKLIKLERAVKLYLNFLDHQTSLWKLMNEKVGCDITMFSYDQANYYREFFKSTFEIEQKNNPED